MAKRRTIKEISRDAWNSAQTLTAGSKDALPAPINEFARSLDVRQIRFAPLLSDAGLAKLQDGFEIVVNADGPWKEGRAGTLVPVDDVRWSQFAPSLRFTVAHEISHLVFLDAAGGKPNADLFRRHERAIENACNILARTLLIPTPALLRVIEDRLFEVQFIRDLLGNFRVSAEVFLRRLHVLDQKPKLSALDGVLAVVKNEGTTLNVKACQVLGDHSLDRFHRALQGTGRSGERSSHSSLASCYHQPRWLLEGRRVTEIDDELDSIIRNGDGRPVSKKIRWSEGRVIPCEVSSIQLDNSRSTFLVSIEVVGSITDADHDPSS